MNEAIEGLKKTLKDNGYSLTAPRLAVFHALLDQEPQTLAELAKQLTGKVDRASIYRIVDLFEKLGVVSRLQIGWKYKLELSDAFAAHHHHMTCTSCGTVIEIEENNVVEFELRQLALEASFHPTGHQLEIRGLCRNCFTSE